MRSYAVIFEQANDGGWGAYAPDLPGLGVVGDSLEEARQLVREGIVLYIESLIEKGEPIPAPLSRTETIEVA